VLVFGFLILSVSGGMIAGKLADIARTVFGRVNAVEITRSSVQSGAAKALSCVVLLTAPVAFGLLAVGVMANLLQVGFLFTVESIRPKWQKFNPLTGLRNLFASRRSGVELVKGLAKVTIVALVVYSALDSLLSDSVSLVDADVGSVVGFMERGAISVGLRAGIAILILAVADYAFQRFEYERDLRMTKQEVKEEFKTLEGDPVVKGRIKTIQRQIAYRRMMADVPKSDVVVTNPTHLALALKYDAKTMASPRLVAKGADLIAQRIREIAVQHNIPIVEDKSLAQALYKSVDLGEEIPEKLFHAVAQVLAYIYRMRDEAFNNGTRK
jgi:flagellar biosynthetic protein FlhB